MPLLAQALKLPTVLWGLPTPEAWGALVSVQQTIFPFKELGLPYRFVTGRLDDPEVWESVLSYLGGCMMQQSLKGLRIGMMGWRAQGMSDVIFDELALRETFGVQIVNLGLTAYTRALQSVPEQAVEQAWSEIKPAFNTGDLPEQVGRYGVRSYLVLKDFVAQNNLGSISLECFHDHLGGPCLGFCLLNDQGIPAPCEDDIPAAILMAAAGALTGMATFHTDIVEADYAADWAIFHHCGNMPLSLANPASRPGLKTHPRDRRPRCLWPHRPGQHETRPGHGCQPGQRALRAAPVRPARRSAARSHGAIRLRRKDRLPLQPAPGAGKDRQRRLRAPFRAHPGAYRPQPGSVVRAVWHALYPCLLKETRR